MIWNYPVPLPLLIAGGIIASFAFFPRIVEKVLASRWFWWMGILIFVAGMLALPSRNHFMGDGMTHLDNPGRLFSPTEPLDIFLHHLVYQLVGSSLWSYRIISMIAGVFYLWGILLMSRLGANPLEKGIIRLAFVSTATIQFYFGYVESYTLVHLFTLYYAYYSIRDLGRKKPSLAPLLYFLLAVASHFAAAVLLPSLVYIYRRKINIYFIAVLVLVLVAASVVAWQVNISQVFVRPWVDRFSAYSIFSKEHLVDLLNLLLLVSPTFFLAFGNGSKGTKVRFGVTALIGTALFAMLVDPKFGAFRDWDLLSIFSLPLACLIALRAPRRYLTAVVLVAVITLRVTPWLVFNSQPQKEFVKKVVDADLHYSAQYDNGYRLVSWAILLLKSGDSTATEAAFLKKAEFDPENMTNLAMLGALQFAMGKFRESHDTYLKMLQLHPDDPDSRYKVAYTAFRFGDHSTALSYIVQAPEDFQRNPATIRLYAGILGATGQHQEALKIIEALPQADKDGYLPYVLSRSCIAVHRFDMARTLLTSAVQLDSTNTSYRHLLDSVSSLR